MNSYKITPTQLTWETNCLDCLVAQMKGWRKPYQPFPSVYQAQDKLMRQYWDGRSTQELGLPPGQIVAKEKKVASAPIQIPDTDVEIWLSGRVDATLRFDTGEIGIMDFKTSIYDPAKLERYWPQLNAYSYCFENPSKGGSPQKALMLGLLVLSPGEICSPQQQAIEHHWKDLPIDHTRLLNLIYKVGHHLTLPSQINPDCQWCRLREGNVPNPSD